METVTNRVSKYVRDKGINIRAMSRGTNISYEILYASVGDKNRNRELRADEFLAICSFLELDPMSFKKAD